MGEHEDRRGACARRALLATLTLFVVAATPCTAAEIAPAAASTPPQQPAHPPEGTWDVPRAERLEHALDAFMAASDRRSERYRTTLASAGVGLSLDELMAMAEPPSIALGVAVKTRTKAQEAANEPRGWFNLELPVDYSPSRACGLVVALHGGDGDGNNLVSLLAPTLSHAGVIVIYPTTSEASHLWGDPVEMAGVLALIEWVGHHYRVDFRRLVVTGGSMGGMGTWSHLLDHPEAWSAGASATGHPVGRGAAFEALRGIPFYITHGELDTNGASLAPVEDVRAAVAELTGRGMPPTYVEIKGAGHQLPVSAWTAMAQWIPRQAPKPWSPRPLFLPPDGQRPLSEVELDPLGLHSADPALALIRAHRQREALRLLNARIAKDPSRTNLLYRALAEVPGLEDAIAPDATAATFTIERGWGRSNETAALADINHAIHVDDHPTALFCTTAYLWAARIHAKRALQTIDQGGTSWVPSWQAFVSNLQACMAADPSNRQGAELALIMRNHLPANLRPMSEGMGGGGNGADLHARGGGTGAGVGLQPNQ